MKPLSKARKDQRLSRFEILFRRFNIREGIDRSSGRFSVAAREREIKRERGFRNWNLTALKRVEKSRRISPSLGRGTEKKARREGKYTESCLEEGEREEEREREKRQKQQLASPSLLNP